VGARGNFRPVEVFRTEGQPFDKLRANGEGWLGERKGCENRPPFRLSLSKPRAEVSQPFDKLRANGEGWLCERKGCENRPPFRLSLSKPRTEVSRPFDKLRANGNDLRRMACDVAR
jgi:hypothetical protein